MIDEKRLPDLRILPLLLQGYIIGTIVGAIVLHIAVAVIAPGDAGTLHALTSGSFLFILLFMVGLIGVVAFPLAAFASWPLRGLVIKRPAFALSICAVVGCSVGAVMTATEFQAGPSDFFSGPLVGLSYGVTWFLVGRNALRKNSSADA